MRSQHQVVEMTKSPKATRKRRSVSRREGSGESRTAVAADVPAVRQDSVDIDEDDSTPSHPLSHEDEASSSEALGILDKNCLCAEDLSGEIAKKKALRGKRI